MALPRGLLRPRTGVWSCACSMDALYAHYVAFLHINIEDIRTTEQVRRAGEALEIELLDHIILGQQRYVSLKERGLGF